MPSVMFVGANWDVEEMEQHRDIIAEKKLLQTSWLPVLTIGSGEGLSAWYIYRMRYHLENREQK
jgi:hypothetical protein